MLSLEAVTVRRSQKKIVSALSLEFCAGEVWQVIGPNGCGKSTFLQVINGIRTPDAGRVLFSHQPLDQVDHRYAGQLFFLGHDNGLNPAFTPREELIFFADMAKLCSDTAITPRHSVREALAQLGLDKVADNAIGRLSSGQQRRVALAKLWLSSACIWVLDEPLNTLDSQGVGILTKQFHHFAEQGGLVIFTSHQDVALPEIPIRPLVLTGIGEH